MYRKQRKNPARRAERALGAGHTAALCCAKVRAVLLHFVARKSAGRFSTLLCESPSGTSPLCSAKVRRGLFHFALLKSAGRFFALLCESPGGTLLRFALRKSCARLRRFALVKSVPGEGVGGFPGVRPGDRAPLMREFPTNSGVGISPLAHNKKTVPKDGIGTRSIQFGWRRYSCFSQPSTLR